jgi:pilus assembly protein FimV
MPSEKFVRAPLWCALSLALGLAATSLQADAAGLGRLTVQSGLGQPLQAELEVTSVGRDELPTLQVKLAPLAAFRAANLEYNPALSNLRFALEKRADGTYFVRINSPQTVNEPYLDLMVELTWSTGRVIREYTVLLDPPSLRAKADVVAPAAPAPAASAPAPAALPPRPAPVASAPVPAPAPAPAPVATAPAKAPVAKPAPEPATSTYTVKFGDTLGKIALQNKTSAVSLDQMLVAMVRQNPEAFVDNNMNRLKAGATIAIPSEAEAAAIAQSEARQEVVAQSADFAKYKSRLAQAAATAPAAAAPPPAAAGGGRVTTRVEEKGAPAPAGGDQLKIAKADDKAGAAAAAAAAKADEATAKARAVQEEQEKAAQLKKTNEAIQKALEVQSKSGAQVQKQAEQKSGPAPTATPAQPAPAETPKAEAPKAEVPAATPAPAPAKKVAPPSTVPQEEPSMFVDMLGNTTTQLALAGIVALLAGLFGWSWLRKRKAEGGDRFKETGEGLQANSLFGATGGQSVDTGASAFNSSFIPAASQLDSNEVDPVAEADVYIAYGREEQAEDILKEALRLQPDREAVRVKLLEIYARRGDKASFMSVIDDLKERTGGEGEDWERALRLGRTLDPEHPMFAGVSNTDIGRGPATGFRLDPNTKSGRPSTLGGGPTTGLDLTGLTANSEMQDSSAGAPPLTRMVVDTRMTDAQASGDTRMPADTRMAGPATTAAPTTQFHATLPGTPDTNTISTPTEQVTDFGSLDFDLGPTKMNLGATTRMPDTESGAKEDDIFAATTPRKAEPPAVADAETSAGGKYPAMPPTATGVGMIPDLDLNIPPSTRMPVPPAPAPAPARVAQPELAEEALSRPTVIGAMRPQGVNTMVGNDSSRLTANTDQATVPLIDFDLSAVSLDAATKRGETEPGSALAQQMATKLDLARGYIDLGVKDGARELLDEVMRDGTRDQRQAAVELIKQIET